MPPPVITLTTDFGLTDEFVGVMKGVILSVCPNARIVDITHQIEPQDILQAAFTLEAAYRYFPKGSVHVVVVDPGVGSERKILAVAVAGHFFLAPDNGILWPIIKAGGVEAVVSVTDRAFFLSPVSRTFHGRDILAPVAAHLAKGTELTRLGPVLDPSRIVRLELSIPRRGKGDFLIGSVLGLDRFGNLTTDIRRADIDSMASGRSGMKLGVWVKNQWIEGLSETYLSAGKGNLLALFDSRGCLEIALCSGNAARHLGAKRGDPVRVVFRNPSVLPMSSRTPPKGESGRKDNRRRRHR